MADATRWGEPHLLVELTPLCGVDFATSMTPLNGNDSAVSNWLRCVRFDFPVSATLLNGVESVQLTLGVNDPTGWCWPAVPKKAVSCVDTTERWIRQCQRLLSAVDCPVSVTQLMVFTPKCQRHHWVFALLAPPSGADFAASTTPLRGFAFSWLDVVNGFCSAVKPVPQPQGAETFSRSWSRYLILSFSSGSWSD
jgi:hypothetical protein